MKKTQQFQLEHFLYYTDGYEPKTTVELSVDDDGFEVYFKSYESPLRAVETEHNTMVCRDSCVEFFVQFDPLHTQDYINFEMNPNGAIYCAKGPVWENRVLIEPHIIETLGRRVEIHEEYWEAWLTIPLSFVQREFPKYEHKSGAVIKGNFYKCGNRTIRPHYGCWKYVEWSSAGFHRPEYFGEIVL